MKRPNNLTLEQVKAHYKACAKALAGKALDWKSIKRIFSIKEKIYNLISSDKLVEIGILIPRYTVSPKKTRGRKLQMYSVRIDGVDYLSLWKELCRLKERSRASKAKSRAKKSALPVTEIIEPEIIEEVPVEEPKELPTMYYEVLPEKNDLEEAIKVILKHGGKVIFE